MIEIDERTWVNLTVDERSASTDNRRPMEITLALLADAANISQEGKLNVLGAFTHINATGFPARHPTMNLVLEFEASVSEAGRERHIEVRLLDADGATLGGLEASFTVPAPVAGKRAQVGAVLPITDVVLLKEGLHVFDILIDGDSKKQVPFSVNQLPTGGETDDDA